MTATEREQARLLVLKFKASGKLEKKPAEPKLIKKGEACPKCGRYQIGDLGECLYCGV